ncbi:MULTISPECIES: hypothetical protein [Pseudoalteromonas]|uniref:hypothetical protein n=1 Tax=Pseudoalteromonas TaxID=53246 RepID=UPI002017A8C1|nr:MULTISPECIES: hypothetical protein [Pseudoalteromonas]MDN3406916.1 hypothetical protein [Pseudoalteromonas sp. APC 3218]MDN3409361.1 hypothetical protein [Pseudoalteromonas sp. APC 3894]MDN3414189.1 hypothetical protein [Pseudoalteromonas sp. APC 3250]MDN3417894.1 hypothetical protein [Pseudoalteromonas sp. APC 3227]MDN3421323.1 hypothetical protein [Pseudoalteromonas sp. APC 3895]
MAVLYCFVKSINTPNKSSLYLAATMLCSYVLSDYLYIVEHVYFNWIVYDFLTIAFIAFAIKKAKVTPSLPAYFIIVGLTINSVLVGFIYYDLYILGNTQEWWFWSFYSISINLIDILMIASLVINLDYVNINQGAKALKPMVKNGVSNG